MSTAIITKTPVELKADLERLNSEAASLCALAEGGAM